MKLGKLTLGNIVTPSKNSRTNQNFFNLKAKELKKYNLTPKDLLNMELKIPNKSLKKWQPSKK